MGNESPIGLGGDWSLRGIDLDVLFAQDDLSEAAMSAAVRASAKFNSSFPGWPLYRRVVNGTGMFDRELEAWAVGCGQALAVAEKRNGRRWVSGVVRAKPGWVEQASMDALDYVIFGRHPAGLNERASRFGVSNKTYQAIRDPMSRCMWIGLETFRSVLFAEYWQVRRDENYPAPILAG